MGDSVCVGGGGWWAAPVELAVSQWGVLLLCACAATLLTEILQPDADAEDVGGVAGEAGQRDGTHAQGAQQHMVGVFVLNQIRHMDAD